MKTKITATILGVTLIVLTSVYLSFSETVFNQEAGHAYQPPGRIAYLDPVTGKLSKTMPPSGLAIPMDYNNARRYSTSDNGLTPEIKKDGTIVVPLQGRFRQGSYAVRDSSGNVQVYRMDGQIFTSPDGKDIARKLYKPVGEAADSQP